MEFTLKLTEVEVATIIAALGELPAKHVVNLLNKIHSEIEVQRGAELSAPKEEVND